MSSTTICAWNARGCSSTSRIKMILELIKKHKITIIGLIETKISKDREVDIAGKMCIG